MLHLIEELVNIESGSHHKVGVDRVGAVLASHLRKLGFEIDHQKLSQCGDRYVATKRLGGQGRLLILGHTDTVWPEGTLAGWPFAIREGRATGPGVGDMKGGLVMALFALQALFESKFDDLGSIRFMLVPDEELGSLHSREAIEHEARDADWVLVLEPGRPGGGVATARGALGTFFMHAHGQEAHCAVNYHKGASAVRELAQKVARLEALSEPDAGAVVNVGIFRGGVAKQVIPGEARMSIDLRARTDDQARTLRDTIYRIASDVADPRVRVEVTGCISRVRRLPRFTTEPCTRSRGRSLGNLASTSSKSTRHRVVAPMETLPVHSVFPRSIAWGQSPTTFARHSRQSRSRALRSVARCSAASCSTFRNSTATELPVTLLTTCGYL